MPFTRSLVLFALVFSCSPSAATDSPDPFARARAEMVAVIEANAETVGSVDGRTRISPQVLAVMGDVPRHAFVPDSVRGAAYEDRPLPIGEGQTISQPYIVALMTDLIDPRPEHVVLEVGTGSGYQAAVLARLVRRVYSIEIIPQLAETARERLARLGFDNVEVRAGDGYAGWEEAAPFDGIVVTAGASHVPPPLVRQLKPGGRMVIPTGESSAVQQLLLVEKRLDGSVEQRRLLPVRFVPLTRRP